MTTLSVSQFHVPQQWVRYNLSEVDMPLVEAKTSAGVLNRLPYLHRWIEQVHEEQLRLEAVGTTRIEGAQFYCHDNRTKFFPQTRLPAL